MQSVEITKIISLSISNEKIGKMTEDNSNKEILKVLEKLDKELKRNEKKGKDKREGKSNEGEESGTGRRADERTNEVD